MPNGFKDGWVFVLDVTKGLHFKKSVVTKFLLQAPSV